MSKFLPQKKKLIEDVFEKASSETTETSFSGILKSLELKLSEDFGIGLSYKTFETYHVKLVQNDEDYNIKLLILEKLSNYLGYNNFNEYCAEWKTVEHSITESISKVVINIINKPLLKMPEFLTKQGNLGIIGMLLFGSLVVGSKMYKADENVSEKSVETKLGILGSVQQKQCMYWNGQEYIPEDCNHTRNNLIAMDAKKVANFKKITRPDTISSINNIWYSKYQNEVEFFTDNGVNPENGNDLRPLTYYILEKYGSGE